MKKHTSDIVLSEQSHGSLQYKHIQLLHKVVKVLREEGYPVFVTLANLRKVVAQQRKRVYLDAILKIKYVKKFAFPKLPKAAVGAALTWWNVMAKQPNRKACSIPKQSRQKLVTKAVSTEHNK